MRKEGTDKITLKSLSKICADLGEKISEEELQEMINEADKDQDEEVGEEDFIKIMQKTGYLKQVHQEYKVVFSFLH